MTELKLKFVGSRNALLIFSDGTIFQGYGFGKMGKTIGEICFNTAMTGYQEILTDPSYSGQIINFTFPHIGNVGTNEEDIETHKPLASGLIVRNKPTDPSNFRSQHSLIEYCEKLGLTGIYGVDTRAITEYIRKNGAQNVMIYYSVTNREVDLSELKEELKAFPKMDKLDLATKASSGKSYYWDQNCWKITEGYGKLPNAKYLVVAYDYGLKLNILRNLCEEHCQVYVVPADTSFEEIAMMNPDGVFLSNGPGDPEATAENHASKTIAKILEYDIPLFGICLGAQMLALAIGARTVKMHQGHRGANHPVKNLINGTVEITSQNHGFMVDRDSLPDNVEITHVSLFDGSIEGFRLKDKSAFSVQYHPESSPGPHDSKYLFSQFVALMKEHQSKKLVKVNA